MWNYHLPHCKLNILIFFYSKDVCWPRIILMHLLPLRTTSKADKVSHIRNFIKISINLIPKVKLQVSQLLLTSEWVLIMGQTLLLSCNVHAILSFNYKNGQNHCSITWSGLSAVYNVIYLGSVRLKLHRGEENMWHSHGQRLKWLLRQINL